MMPVLMAGLLQYVFGFTLTFTGMFLILLVLVQRGRGGGLTGALGGVGGQSAFGTKAGDLFTKITIGCAVTWIFLCMLTIVMLNGQGEFQPTRPGMIGTFNRGGATPDGQPEGGAANGESVPAESGGSPATE
jgi:preprotein translocase subunit SecG